MKQHMPDLDFSRPQVMAIVNVTPDSFYAPSRTPDREAIEARIRRVAAEGAAIIDIGGYTTDVLLLQNGKPDLQFCRSLETGVITMNNDVIRKVSTQYDMKIEDEHIAAVLQGRKIYLPEEVKQEIFRAAQSHANDILNQLRELQVDLRANPAIFIGGGSVLLQPYLSESPLVGSAEFIDSPNANALGYEMLGEKQLARLRG